MKRSMAIEPARLFIDTWGWLALADAKDPAHQRAVHIRRSHAGQGSLVTTDYILDETITRLFSRCPFSPAHIFCEGIFEARTLGMLTLEVVTPDRFERAWKLRMRYRDKPHISFTDLTSFVVMQELGIREVLTADSHFAKVHLGFRIAP
jgi:predicted nucleic acid-binding protein